MADSIQDFTYRSDLEMHHRTHTGEKLFKCLGCGKQYSKVRDQSRGVDVC